MRTRKPLVAAAVVLLLAGCVRTVEGGGVAQQWAPDRVAGLPITDGPAGQRPGAPGTGLRVTGGDGGAIDNLAAGAVEDVQAYWQQQFPALAGTAYEPLAGVTSYDSDAASSRVCGIDTAGLVNAFYCGTGDTVSWDRGQLLPTLAGAFGEISVVAVLAHELGHAVQNRLGAGNAASIVREQQADCYTGGYFRHVAEGRSARFQVSTGPGLNQVLSTLFFIRDGAGASVDSPDAHGNAFDRVSAFQLGFGEGPARCARIDLAEVNRRVTQTTAQDARDAEGNLDIADPEALRLLEQTLGAAFGPARPQLVDTAGCAPGAVSYCAEDDTVHLDLTTLSAIGAEPAPQTRGIGDFAAFAEVASRYALALQRARDLSVEGLAAAQRTACLTGAWAATIVASRRQALQLSPGDLDEAVAEMLTADSLIAADARGVSVPSGFARVDSFRRGFTEGTAGCG
ncbi:neutral zinc metallopeptidase [Actinoplanes sp. NPDC051494]|uniref:neutral zinc metallopeptidase n=1 Tax=Actinoplanes sp. NPDC051494 TaxID=3363907 RepID=UPI0037A6828C